ncbi:ribbon-helix-helix domain-containing protein [Paenibacillus luteus]|uniref:ribbon-helix-helix domain-containing protein n=1 Tax=Paenibacillus luteus TaxID=2545753 RepID=UPI001142A95B|nr:ribbon-helix-helix domain-containing protein [Paenibacillus luteus]
MGRKPKTATYENAILQLISNENTGKKTISITLPESLISDLDYIARELVNGNRSLVCEKGLLEFAEACKAYIENGKKKVKQEGEK